jgi:hypothetical protein
MIFAYLKVAQVLSHEDAYRESRLRSKRMGNKMPNGNIIVDANGTYNRFDGGAHRHKFDKIKHHYVIGSETESRMLTSAEVERLAPAFLQTLRSILAIEGSRPFDIISRKGRILTARQVRELLAWLNSTTP